MAGRARASKVSLLARLRTHAPGHLRTVTAGSRRGVLVEEQGQTYVADSDGDSDEACTLRPLQAAACTYRIAFGPRRRAKEKWFFRTLCDASTSGHG